MPELAADLRARFHGDPEYAARWAALPRGSRPLDNPLGGAPGFRIENTWVLPGLPSEMEAMFDLYADELAADRPIGSWRRRYRDPRVDDRHRRSSGDRALAGRVGRLVPELRRTTGPEVEVVLKSADPDALARRPSRGSQSELDRLT